MYCASFDENYTATYTSRSRNSPEDFVAVCRIHSAAAKCCRASLWKDLKQTTGQTLSSNTVSRKSSFLSGLFSKPLRTQAVKRLLKKPSNSKLKRFLTTETMLATPHFTIFRLVGLIIIQSNGQVIVEL